MVSCSESLGELRNNVHEDLVLQIGVPQLRAALGIRRLRRVVSKPAFRMVVHVVVEAIVPTFKSFPRRVNICFQQVEEHRWRCFIYVAAFLPADSELRPEYSSTAQIELAFAARSVARSNIPQVS